MPNEAGFIGTWSKLRWHLKPTSFFTYFLGIRVCELISVKYSFFKPIHSNTSAYEKAYVFYFFATNMASTPFLLCVEEPNIII